MANESRNLGTQRTIRDYLLSELVDTTEGVAGVGLSITIADQLCQVYNVDLLWSGQEYLISYKTSDSDEVFPVIKRLNDVLPISFYKTTATTTS